MPAQKPTIPISPTEHEKTKAGAPAVQLYHPSVFRYSCRGRLRLDSRLPGAGVCHGMQTQLQAVEHLRLGTKEEALNYFQQKSALGGEGDMPTEAADNTGAAHALQSAYMSNVLVYPKHQDEKDKPEDSTEKWSCVGSTEIDLLVLRAQDTKEEQIAAVSPYCAPGMTTRDVTTPTLGRDRTSTVRLGFIEIVYVSSVATDGIDDEEDESMSLPPQQHQQQQQQEPSQTSHTTDQKEDNNKNPKVPARKPTKSNKEKQSMPRRIYNSSSNIMQHMQFNAKLLYQATQDDFPNRTVAASKRLVQEFDTTLNRTVGLMKRVIYWDWDDDDDKKN